MPMSGRASRTMSPAWFGLTLVSLFASSLIGCDAGDTSASTQSSKTVVLYCSVDEPFAREVVAAFEKDSGITVQIKTDTEAGKTTGLVNRIRAEKSNPQADVFWSSELFNTIQLADEGILTEYRPPTKNIPDRYKDPEGKWTAFGLRGRVVGYNTELVEEEALPGTWRELTDERWQGRLGVADPHFGTTRGHFAAMLALWGEEDYVTWLAQLREVTNGTLQDGNATAARKVGRGELLICATDTDDVIVRQERDEPVAMVFPDMGDGGTLLIPNSVAMMEGAPNPEAAKQLIDYLTSAVTERMLAESDSRNYPVRETLRNELGMELPPETKLGFREIADAMDKAIRLAGEHLMQ